MKHEINFPLAIEGTPLQRLVAAIEAEWPEMAAERRRIAANAARHAAGDRLQAASDRLERDVGQRLGDLADDLAQADAALAGAIR